MIVPGILGTTLVRGKRQVWGYRQVFRSVHHLGDRLTQDLSLPGAVFQDPAAGYDDGVRTDGPLKTLGILPGLVAMDGYDRLVQQLRDRFPGDPGAIHEFPYDWRQSNEYSALMLRNFVWALLAVRRTVVPDAKVVLIGHSMGGLVARFFAECLDERRDTRRLVTIGTPFQGSVKALTVLANGFTRIGPVKIALGELARSLPSVAELLPTYDCVGASVSHLENLSGQDGVPSMPGLPRSALERSQEFHRKMREAVAANGDDRPAYHALLSHWHATDLWALVDDRGEVRAQSSTGFEHGGDGTVPRCSATPPEWADDANGIYLAGKHAALQQQGETIVQLRGILSAQTRRPQAAVDAVSVTAPAYVDVHADWLVEATSVEGSDSLVLTLTVWDPEDTGAPPVTEVALRATGQGVYRAVVRNLPAGLFRWTVRTALTAATPVDPVSDIVLCAAAD
ncbi:hypothetical protein ABUW04_15840 [Streptacidiphilus sp. N1-10]|uniref:Lecithin:cholesterol acyltransferase n=1 Tax=Streptacidiphilus jeojiensis TaxID=3229225 RepID=A0ABV6XND7_9ACTN